MKRCEPQYGTFTMAAEALRQAYGERKGSLFCGVNFTRQIVYNWWTRRENNGFPSKQDNGLLNLDDVLSWYLSYEPDRGGRPVINA